MISSFNIHHCPEVLLDNHKSPSNDRTPGCDAQKIGAGWKRVKIERSASDRAKIECFRKRAGAQNRQDFRRAGRQCDIAAGEFKREARARPRINRLNLARRKLKSYSPNESFLLEQTRRSES